jgi:hypothetical protein
LLSDAHNQFVVMPCTFRQLCCTLRHGSEFTLLVTLAGHVLIPGTTATLLVGETCHRLIHGAAHEHLLNVWPHSDPSPAVVLHVG